MESGQDQEEVMPEPSNTQDFDEALNRQFYELRRMVRKLRQDRDFLRGRIKQKEKRGSESYQFLRGLLVQIGELFGEAAKISDDGAVQQDILLLKLPELVQGLKRENDQRRKVLADILEIARGDWDE